MIYAMSDQMYRGEHGLSAAGQRAADERAGRAAAALRDLRLSIGRAIRPRPRVRPDRTAAKPAPGGVAAAAARVLSGTR